MVTQNGFINIDGNKIIYRGTGYENVLTSQPIPANLRSFIFKTKIVECSKDVEISLGFKFDDGFILWRSNSGNLDNEEKVIMSLEPYGKNDDISCYLRRISVKEKDYQYVNWIKNGKVIGSWMIEGDNVFPSFRCEALDDSLQAAELETSFDIKATSNTSGKFFMTQKS